MRPVLVIVVAALAGWATALTPLSARSGEPAWSEVNGPTQPPALAIGSPARGCVAGAEMLPLSGPGYEVMRPSRERFYGHPRLIAFIRDLAMAAQESGWPGLLVGDLGQARGGPTSSGHRSHQNGLDVDLWFQPAPADALSTANRETMAADSVLDAGGRTVDAHRWTARHTRLIATVVAFPEVDRVFVNPAIKQVLCDQAGDERGWLRKIRPWWGHDDHLHVRIACPEENSPCEAQPAVPAGDGCDADLAWWFSVEAAQEQARRAQAPPARRLTLDDLPPLCRSVLFSE